MSWIQFWLLMTAIGTSLVIGFFYLHTEHFDKPKTPWGLRCKFGSHDYRIAGPWQHWRRMVGNYGFVEPGSICAVECARCGKRAQWWQCYDTGIGSMRGHELNALRDNIGERPPRFDVSTSKSKLVIES